MYAPTTPSSESPRFYKARSFVEIEKFFDDKQVIERFLPKSATKQHPPGRGYGDGLVKLFRERAVQVLIYGGDHRWRKKQKKLMRLQELADGIFFKIYRTYALNRAKFHRGSASLEKEDVDDGELSSEEDEDEYEKEEEEDEEERSKTGEVASVMKRVNFYFEETDTRRIGDGSSSQMRGSSRRLSKRTEQANTILFLYHHFYNLLQQNNANVDESLVLRMLKPTLTTNEGVELLSICESVFEIVERQKLVSAAYEDSTLCFAECLEYERCVHALYLSKLQLLDVLRNSYNGNESNKDWLLVDEMLTVRELDATAYEKILNFSRSLMRPPYTRETFFRYALMTDMRSKKLHSLVTAYFHERYVIGLQSEISFPTPKLATPPTPTLVLEFMLNSALKTTSARNWIHYPSRGSTDEDGDEQMTDTDEQYLLKLQAFWKLVFVHCISLFPTMFIDSVFNFVAKRETTWEISIHDVLRYVDALAFQDPFYVCWAQKIVYRYFTYESNALIEQFSALHDTENVLFSLYIPNKFSSLSKRQELQSFMARGVNLEKDLRDRPFHNGYTTATKSSSTAPVGYDDQDDQQNNPGFDDLHTPFTYDPRYCQMLPNLPYNYRILLEHFFELRIYRDAIQTGSHYAIKFVSWYYNTKVDAQTIELGLEMLSDEPDVGNGNKKQKEKMSPLLMYVLQLSLNYVNATCWFFDGHFVHSNNANCYSPIDRKRFHDRLKLFNQDLKMNCCNKVSFDYINLEEMISHCYRFSSVHNAQKFAKVAKIIGNTQATRTASSVNFAFVRIKHNSLNAIMSNVHVNSYELTAPSVLFLLTLDTRNFYTDDGEHFPFNVNQNATDYILECWQNVSEYLKLVVPTDAFSMLLYAPLVKEKKLETIFTELRVDASFEGSTSSSKIAGENQTEGDVEVQEVETVPLHPQPGIEGSKKRRRKLNNWDSLIGTPAKKVNKCNSSLPLENDSTDERVNSNRGKDGKQNEALPILKNEQFIGYTLDKEEFFTLAKHVDVEWAYQTYTRRKSFRYFVAAMMQLLNEYGEQLIVRENGLRLSVNVLLQRSYDCKPVDDLFAERSFSDDDDEDDDDDAATNEDSESEKHESSVKHSRNKGETNGVAGGSTESTSTNLVDLQATRKTTDNKLNLSLLLDTNTKATELSEFLTSMLKLSLTNEEMRQRQRAYFRRLPSAMAQQLFANDEKNASEDDPRAAKTEEHSRQWYNFLQSDYRQKGTAVRPLHEELMYMNNILDLMYDLFHKPNFYNWVTATVERGDLYTNNLLDFGEDCFVLFFVGYLYALRTIDKRSAKKKSGFTRLIESDVSCEGPESTQSPTVPTTLSEYFRTYGSEELAQIQSNFVCRQVSSANLVNMACGLRKYLEMKHVKRTVPNLRPSLTSTKRDGICYFILCLYTFCDCNLAYALYLFRLILSVKYPGSWSKTLHILQGSSNSGKSELIELLRSFFNSTNGVINPNVWRSASTNDIGTSLFPLMENLLCQSDEVDYFNNTLLKTVVSKTAKQCRSFGSQESQQLQTLSKVFVTVNKLPQVDQSDEGVLTRLQVMMPVFHRYLPLIQRDTDTTKKQNLSSFSPAHQLNYGIYPVGAQPQNYTIGLFYCFMHYGQYISTKDVTAFRAADSLHLQHVLNFLSNRVSVKLCEENVDYIDRSDDLTKEAIFVACHTNIDQLLNETTNFDHEINRDELYFLTHDLVQTIDPCDSKVHVNITHQPMIATLFREDAHANMDPMVKFDVLYKVIARSKSVDWIYIERLLRDHLIDFYNNEDRGDLSLSNYLDEEVLLKPTAGSTLRKKSVVGAGFSSATFSGSYDDNHPLSSNAAKFSRRINFKAFYDRFKNRFSHMQKRDPQTRHIVPNKWCLTIKRNK